MCWTHAGGFGPIWVFGTASYNNHWEKLSRQLNGEDVPVSSMSGKRNEDVPVSSMSGVLINPSKNSTSARTRTSASEIAS